MPKIRFLDPSSYIIFTSISLGKKNWMFIVAVLLSHPHPHPMPPPSRRAPPALSAVGSSAPRPPARWPPTWPLVGCCRCRVGACWGLLGMGIWTWKFYCQSLLVQFFIQDWIIFSVTSIWSKTIAQESTHCVCFLSNAHFYAPSRGTFIVSHSAYLSAYLRSKVCILRTWLQLSGLLHAWSMPAANIMP